MPKAIWNGAIIAQSDHVETVENNLYFPPESINKEYLKSSPTSTHCPWKGDAAYYSLIVDGKENSDAAWYYPDPKEKALHIKDHVAFWKGVEIIND